MLHSRTRKGSTSLSTPDFDYASRSIQTRNFDGPVLVGRRVLVFGKYNFESLLGRTFSLCRQTRRNHPHRRGRASAFTSPCIGFPKKSSLCESAFFFSSSLRIEFPLMESRISTSILLAWLFIHHCLICHNPFNLVKIPIYPRVVSKMKHSAQA